MPNADAGLPRWDRVLVVVAHPDDESFGLGAVLSSFVDAGADVSVLCFTQGEASTLHGVEGDLATIRRGELAEAAAVLGISSVTLLDYPDGGLADAGRTVLEDRVAEEVAARGCSGLLVFDSNGITGHPDHIAATAAATSVARRLGLGVLAWSLPTVVAATLSTEFGMPFAGHSADDLPITVTVDRSRQRRAVECHPSQAVPGSALWRRLDLLGDHEHLRWLVPSTTSSG